MPDQPLDLSALSRLSPRDLPTLGVTEGLAWYDLGDLPLEGRGWPDTAHPYDRFPARAEGVIPAKVWGLSRCSAGLRYRFVTDATDLAKQVDAKSADLRAVVREIEITSLTELMTLLVRKDFINEFFQLVMIQIAVSNRCQLAMQSQNGGHTDGQVDIRAPLLATQLQKGIDARRH